MENAVRIMGLRKLDRELRRLGAEIPKQLREVSKDAAELVASEARSVAPQRSGRLAASVRASGTARGGVVRAGLARVPYAGVIHFGWPRHHIAPQPFLYEALDRRREEVIRRFEQDVAALIERTITPGTGE